MESCKDGVLADDCPRSLSRQYPTSHVHLESEVISEVNSEDNCYCASFQLLPVSAGRKQDIVLLAQFKQ